MKNEQVYYDNALRCLRFYKYSSLVCSFEPPLRLIISIEDIKEENGFLTLTVPIHPAPVRASEKKNHGRMSRFYNFLVESLIGQIESS